MTRKRPSKSRGKSRPSSRIDEARSRAEGAPRLKVRVKTAKKRANSSTRWLDRQLNDPYVAAAQEFGYRSRAAFKLAELDDKYGFLTKGARVLDLGAAPGGWSQLAVERCGSTGRVLAVDILEMDPLDGVEVMQQDFMADEAPERIRKALGGAADVVLTDMAAPTTGHRQTDHLRIMALCEAAAHFAMEVLAPGGTFVAKIFKGGAEGDLLTLLKQNFETVRHMKPKSSRQESAEAYLVATGFKGGFREDEKNS